jgi:hypothetical protein
MKGIALVYGGFLLLLLLGSLVIIDVAARGDLKRDVVTIEGKLSSFVNEAELLIKNFDQSVYFISQRAAYDLGKTGGIEGSQPAIWDESYPKLEDLEMELEERIRNNLPVSFEEGERTITFGDDSIDVMGYSSGTCGSSIGNSECFFVDGSKDITIYDDSIDSRISLKPHEFYTKIDSNYFKLLNAGRAIFEDPDFNGDLDDYGALLIKLNNDPDFSDLIFWGSLINDDTVEIVIKEVDACYPSDTYCLAPLKTTESGSVDPSIPYDFVELRLRYVKEQTGSTENPFDFSLLIDSLGEEAVCE